MSNLPAGFAITSIDGLRCTAVPRSATVLTGSLASEAATLTIASTSTAAPETAATISSNPQVQGIPPNAASAPSSPAVAPAIPTSTTSASPIVTSTSAVVFIGTATPPPAISSFTTSTSAINVSKGTTPTTASSVAPIAIAQSEVSTSEFPSPTTLVPGINMNGSGLQAPTLTSLTPEPVGTNTSSEASSATAGITPTPRVSTGPIVGGVVGSAALIGLIGLLFFLFRRRRRGRESLLTPLTTGRRSSFYDNDDMSVGPTGRGQRWKNNLGWQTDRIRNFGTGIKTGLAGIGASVKSKVAGDRSDTPSVDLNRGNSQFLDGPIPQHSRNNSVLSSNGEKVSLKEKAADFFDKIKESSVFNVRFGKKTEPADPFAAARGMTEKQASSAGAPDFSQLLGMEDRDLQLQAERRRASFAKNTNSIPQLGSLGLDFGSIDDPFADPVKNSSANRFSPSKVSNAKTNPFADPTPSTTRSNPFADPARPEPAMPKPNTYIAAIRRSRGQSIDNANANANPSGYRPPSTAVGSRYPSSIAPSRDSYRDTVFSSFSANARKGKGRSDPFDLERPELWSSRENSQGSNLYPNPLNPNGAGGNPNPLRMSSVKNIGYGTNSNKDSRIMSTASYASKYSSGVSSLGNEWGDPGPDLGPGSSSSSMRGNAGSNGGSVDLGMGSSRAEEIKKWDERRGKDNVSPVSKASSKNGVGKAM